MHMGFKDVWAALFWGLILPGILLNGAVYLSEGKAEPVVQGEPVAEPLKMKLRQEDETLAEMDMDGYLVGVVLAEMPASFEVEALKAQAVAARTFAAKAGITGGKHGDGSVCGSSRCCQAYIEPGAYLEGGGTEENLEKVRSAVADTSGYVLSYGGELIEAVYFSCSGGSTEDAAAVWGAEYPYLQAVESPGEEGASVYWDSVSYSLEDFQAVLGVSLEGSGESWFGETLYTEGGGVAEMDIGGVRYSGTELRSLLGLRSTAFSVAVEENRVTFTTRGYGHRVGMSQYGAEAMAVAGSGFGEILAHYYRGAVLAKLDGDGNFA